MINIGINGFGRIGKCLFLQLIENDRFSINAINTSMDFEEFEQYISNDSVHGRRNFEILKTRRDNYQINGKNINIINERDPSNIEWEKYNVKYLFETTGKFLSKEDLNKHKVGKVILSSPPRDNIPVFCYGVNHHLAEKDKIYSTASCTTNCLTPFLNICNQINKIKFGTFITIHSATSSQSVIDRKQKKRTDRSVFNNIIPHTTGASKSVDLVIPEIKGLVKGTSVRVPTINVSMIDLNLTFEKDINLNQLLEIIERNSDPEIIKIIKTKPVSSDINTLSIPTIIDYFKCFQINENTIKFTIWYDNEWSYAAQMIRFVNYIYDSKK